MFSLVMLGCVLFLVFLARLGGKAPEASATVFVSRGGILVFGKHDADIVDAFLRADLGRPAPQPTRDW